MMSNHPELSLQPSGTTVTMSDIFSLPGDDGNNKGRQLQPQRSWLQHRNQRNLPPPPPEAPPRKLLNVTISILSLAGVHAKESGKKKAGYKSKFTRNSNKQQQNGQDDETGSDVGSFASGDQVRSTPTTTLVTSFERAANDPNSNKTITTHIPSLPLPLSQPSFGRNNASTFSDVICWPEQGEETHSKLSSYTFQRYFPREEVSSSPSTSDGNNNDNDNANSREPRYVPQLCPIQISISRNGKMFKLGSAHVFVSGDENGEYSMNVPVVNFETAFKSRGGGSSKVSMMRLKGDTVKCGLADQATLRVLVRVTDPLTPRIQVNYALSSSDRTKGTSNRAGVVNTQVSCNRSVGTADNSEASFEYDPAQRAVVIKKKNKENKNGSMNLSSPSVMFSKEIRRKEASVVGHPQQQQTFDDDDQSHTIDTASTLYSETSSSSSSSASSRSTYLQSFSHDTEDCTLNTDSSEEILSLINDISKNPSNGDDTMTMSSSIQSWGRKPSTKSKKWDDGDDEYTVSTYSSGSGSSSIATPLLSPRAIAAAERARNKPSMAAMMINQLTQKFGCCAGGAAGTANVCDENDWQVDSIDEDLSLDNDMYNLEAREHSDRGMDSLDELNMDETNHCRW